MVSFIACFYFYYFLFLSPQCLKLCFPLLPPKHLNIFKAHSFVQDISSYRNLFIHPAKFIKCQVLSNIRNTLANVFLREGAFSHSLIGFLWEYVLYLGKRAVIFWGIILIAYTFLCFLQRELIFSFAIFSYHFSSVWPHNILRYN